MERFRGSVAETAGANLNVNAAAQSAGTRVAGMSVSVAMATYNGAAYLQDQLDTLAAQTRLPDELVVCDDGSTDETLEILERFAAAAPFEVRVVRNPQRLGYGRNFMQAAHLSRGDLIAWCDQDDTWMPAKIASCAAVFEQDHGVVLVVHSRRIGDWLVPGRLRGARPLIRGVRRRRTHDPRSLPFWISAPGYACVIARRVLELSEALEADEPGTIDRFSGHDTFTTFLAGAIGNVVLLPDVLVQYRQHRDQVAGAPPPQTMSGIIRESAGRRAQQLVENLGIEASRASFRACMLRRVSARLEALEPGSGRGAAFRARMWDTNARVVERRRLLWCQRPRSMRSWAMLIRGIVSGDYGRRAHGRLGLKSLARDVWQVARASAGGDDGAAALAGREGAS